MPGMLHNEMRQALPGGVPGPADAARPGPVPAPPAGGGPAGPAPAAPESPGAAKRRGNVTPKRQQQYDVVVSNALKFLSGERRDQVLARIGQSPRPVEQAGVVAGDVLAMAVGSAQNNGVALEPSVLLHAAREVTAATLELAAAAQIIEEPGEEQVARALTAAATKVLTAARQAGLFTQEEGTEGALAQLRAQAQGGGGEGGAA